ncbi:hypothetical protein ACFQZJ_17925 [Maribacter chungangensis]|uniref:Carboxypeptidase-like regulatory domain-containing protein n=1 Tax=Maribacter chungangensis TaxID=1069117 RepID=A0ABW3B8F8_9FLAO
MNKVTFLFLVCSGVLSYGQQSHSGIVLTLDGGEPLEFVSVFNITDHTMTNEDGRFQFSSQIDSVFFYTPGYEKLKTTFSALRDTIYLQKNIVNLDEVVITNAKTILDRIRDSIGINYLLSPHTETFFIRALLRRNDTIMRLQDMYGNLRRKTSVYAGELELEKKDYEVELLQMRQVGIKKDKNNVYFIFPSFFDIFSEFVRINAMGPDFDVIEKPLENTNEIRVEFSPSKADVSGGSSGSYIINALDNAILSFEVSTKRIIAEPIRQRPEYHGPILLESATYFTKDKGNDRYFMNYGKRKIIVESKTKDQKEPTKFQIEILLHTTNPFSQLDLKSNVNEQKDVFTLKSPYNETFWKSQNQLLLTEEMLKFITNLAEDNKEFKVKSNLD